MHGKEKKKKKTFPEHFNWKVSLSSPGPGVPHTLPQQGKKLRLHFFATTLHCWHSFFVCLFFSSWRCETSLGLASSSLYFPPHSSSWGTDLAGPIILVHLPWLAVCLVINHWILCSCLAFLLPAYLWSLQNADGDINYRKRASELPVIVLLQAFVLWCARDTAGNSPLVRWVASAGRQVPASRWMSMLQLTPATCSSGNWLLWPLNRW